MVILMTAPSSPVADALRMPKLEGLADMEAQAGWQDQPWMWLPLHPRSARYAIHVGTHAVQVVQHVHLPVVLAHRQIGVLWLHKVQPHHVRVRAGDLEGQQLMRLREAHLHGGRRAAT